MSHNHGPGHECEVESGDTNHDHSLEMGIEYSLFAKIDTENLECLNELDEGTGKKVCCPFVT